MDVCAVTSTSVSVRYCVTHGGTATANESVCDFKQMCIEHNHKPACPVGAGVCELVEAAP